MKNAITIIGINYFPEDSAIGLYSTQMSQYLAEKGYQVDIITGVPYYPQWKIWDSYKNSPLFIDENHDGINIHRYKQYVPQFPLFRNRILHLVDFTLGSIRNLLKVKKCDLVIAIVPFTTSIFLGIILAKMRGAKLWVHIQDFEFDAAKDSNLTGGGHILFSIFMKIERWLLRHSDIVSTISYGMIEKLKTKTITPYYFFPNWVDPIQINPETSKLHPFLQSDKFKILYSGNIGAKQDWDFFISIVEHYHNNDKVEFILVGDGAKKYEVLNKISHFDNVFYHEPIDLAVLSDLLCSADLHVLFQKKSVIDTVMASKILGMMASAKPSIVTGNALSETATIFAESQGGYFVDCDNFKKVVGYIDALQKNPKLCRIMGNAGRKYVIEKYSKTMVLDSFVTQVASICEDT